MTLQIFSDEECPQGSESWFRARMGIPTASEFKTIIAVKKDAREKKTRMTYMRKLAAERIRNMPMEVGYSNEHMERGKEQENMARETYAFHVGLPVQRVGFIRNGSMGCSPDAIVGEGGVEIKCALSHIQLERLQDNELPAEFRHQVMGNMFVTKRPWWDFVSFCPGMRTLILRVFRDEQAIKEIEAAVHQFNNELDVMVATELNHK